MSIFKLLFALFIIPYTVALPGVDDYFDYSQNSEYFSSEAIECQKIKKGKSSLLQLENHFKKMNCNRIEDPKLFCSCVSKVSVNGLALKDSEEEIAKQSFKDAAFDISMKSITLDIDVFPGINEFLGSLKSSDNENGTELFKQCFENGNRIFRDIEEIKAMKPSSLNLLQKAKLKMYGFIETKATENNENMSNDKSFYHGFKNILSNPEADVSLISSTPFMSLAFDSNGSRIQLRNDFLGDTDPTKISRGLLNSVRRTKVKEKCTEINATLEKSLNSELQSRVEVSEIMISGSYPDLATQKLVSANIKSKNYEKGKQTGMEMFYIDKLFCRNLRKANNGQSELEQKRIDSNPISSDYQSSYKDIRSHELSLFEKKQNLKKFKDGVSTNSSDLSYNQDMLDLILYLESIDSVSDIRKDHPLISKLDVEIESKEDLDDLVSEKQSFLENVKNGQIALDESKKKAEDLATIVKSSDAALAAKYSDLKILENKLVADVGSIVAGEMINSIKTEMSLQIHKNQIVENMNSIKDRENLSDVSNREFVRRGVQARAIRKLSKSLVSSSNISESRVNRIEAINNDYSPKTIEDRSDETRTNKVTKTNNYFKNIDSFVTKEKEIDTTNDMSKSREDKLQQQIDALQAIIDKKDTEPVESSNSEIAQLKKDLELQKVMNEKKALKEKLKDLKENNLATKNIAQAKVESSPVAPRTREYKSIPLAPVTTKRSNFATSGGQTSNNISGSSNPAKSSALAVNNSSQSNFSKTDSRGSSQSNRISSNLEKFTLSSKTESNGDDSSRIVKLDFKLDSIPEGSRNAFFESLFLQGEEAIVLELPNGEKVIVQNNNVSPGKAKKVERALSSLDVALPVEKKRTTVKYEDLKLLIDSNLDVE